MNGKVYYNEWDKKIAAILAARIADGSLPAGDLDTRSIEDVRADELRGYTSCHFFAGIGGWPLALRQAGWPDDRPVWTGSCPCQPWSQNGDQKGFDDDRDLWPEFHRLIRECTPSVIFGEQVTNSHADAWVDVVQADVEALDYAFGAVPFPAAGVGSPQQRHRLYWLAHAQSGQERWQGKSLESERGSHRGRCADDSTYWAGNAWIVCSDGKRRPIEPGTLPLADGLPRPVDGNKGYGNAIVIPAAREFIEAYIDYHVESVA